MSLTPFHIHCPYTDMVLCRCEKFYSKKDTRILANTARTVYQLYSKVNPEYAKEFGLESIDGEEGPTISYRVTVNAKTAGIRDVPVQPVFQGPPPLPTPQQRAMMVQPNVTQSPVQYSSPPQAQTFMRFVNARNALQQQQQIQQQPSAPRPPPLPQPTTPQQTGSQQTSFRTPFNNSNIKIISASNLVQQPTPIKEQQRTISPTPSISEVTPRVARNRRSISTLSSTSNSNEPKKRGRPRKRRVCDNCGEGDAQETGIDKNLLQCVNCKMCIHTHCHDPTLDHVPLEYRKSWRCEDCKICEICVEAGNEEQLLICETCDRGFHTYCLQPPLQQIPKGSWTCMECKNPKPQPQIHYVQTTSQSNDPFSGNNFFLHEQDGSSFTVMQKTIENEDDENNNEYQEKQPKRTRY
jgi:hypothetical protein